MIKENLIIRNRKICICYLIFICIIGVFFYLFLQEQIDNNYDNYKNAEQINNASDFSKALEKSNATILATGTIKALDPIKYNDFLSDTFNNDDRINYLFSYVKVKKFTVGRMNNTLFYEKTYYSETYSFLGNNTTIKQSALEDFLNSKFITSFLDYNEIYSENAPIKNEITTAPAEFDGTVYIQIENSKIKDVKILSEGNKIDKLIKQQEIFSNYFIVLYLIIWSVFAFITLEFVDLIVCNNRKLQ